MEMGAICQIQFEYEHAHFCCIYGWYATQSGYGSIVAAIEGRIGGLEIFKIAVEKLSKFQEFQAVLDIQSILPGWRCAFGNWTSWIQLLAAHFVVHEKQNGAKIPEFGAIFTTFSKSGG